MEGSETFYIILRFHSLSVHISTSFDTLPAENNSNFLLTRNTCRSYYYTRQCVCPNFSRISLMWCLYDR